MVVPRMPTSVAQYAAVHSTRGIRVARSNGGPVRVRQKCSGDVGKQGESEPFEDPGDEAITGPEQQAYQEDRVRGRPIERPDTGQKLRDVSHAAEIRGDVDDIGDERAAHRRSIGSTVDSAPESRLPTRVR